MQDEEIDEGPDNCCQGACEFHGYLWCKYYKRPCSEYCALLESN